MMTPESIKTIISKIKALFPGLRDRGPGALPAVIILILLGLILLFFDVVGKIDSPTVKVEGPGVHENPKLFNYMAREPSQDELSKVIEATKKRPFKAKITTEAGFKGYWIQDGLNYRFVDPAKARVVIINSAKKKLWVINLNEKVAYETPLKISSPNDYKELVPALIMEGFSPSTAMETKNIEDILPGGKNVKLTFTPDGLPDRWDGSKKDGTPCFIDWDYYHLGSIPPIAFVPLSGTTINKTVPSTTTTVRK
ncbi:MAG TPA: hypothetical protein VE439_03050 [Anaerolineae bacterium]|jgi:hypothetical protein|nr:hypothetical protein [Anaerolineae bacterium]